MSYWEQLSVKSWYIRYNTVTHDDASHVQEKEDLHQYVPDEWLSLQLPAER